MASWPDIRAPQRDGWRATSPDGVRRTSMDAGPAKARIDSTAAPGRESFEWRGPVDQADTLRAFYDAHKAERIDLTHWEWGGAVQVMFAGPIQWGRRGAFRTASFSLDVYF